MAVNTFGVYQAQNHQFCFGLVFLVLVFCFGKQMVLGAKSALFAVAVLSGLMTAFLQLNKWHGRFYPRLSLLPSVGFKKLNPSKFGMASTVAGFLLQTLPYGAGDGAYLKSRMVFVAAVGEFPRKPAVFAGVGER